MQTAVQTKYLGDYITVDGLNSINIKERENKGIGAVMSVTSILKEVSPGHHYFSIGLLLRNTNVINSILFNSEVWFGLTLSQIETLESIDIQFYRRLFQAHSKTAKEAFYLETGKVPIRIIIQVRRLMYWWHINNLEETSLIKKCYKAQKVKPVKKKHWIQTIEKDKKDFNINLQDKDLKKIKKGRFKNFIKKEAVNVTLRYLNTLKEKHSKSLNLNSDQLEAQEYLFDDRLNP